jgi:hypothetical protein
VTLIHATGKRLVRLAIHVRFAMAKLGRSAGGKSPTPLW